MRTRPRRSPPAWPRVASTSRAGGSSLRRPIADSEARIAALRRGLGGAQQLLDDLHHRLAAAQERLSVAFTKARDDFFVRALPDAERSLATSIQGEDESAWTLRARGLEHAVRLARRSLDRWQTEQEPRVAALYRDAVTRFRDLVDLSHRDLAAVPGLERLPPSVAEPRLRAAARFYYTEMLATAPTSALRRLLDVMCPRALRVRVVQRAATRYLRQLLEVNSTRLKNDFRERVTESREQLEEELRNRVREIAASAERALDQAERARREGAGAVEARLGALARLRARLGPLSGDGAS